MPYDGNQIQENQSIVHTDESKSLQHEEVDKQMVEDALSEDEEKKPSKSASIE